MKLENLKFETESICRFVDWSICRFVDCSPLSLLPPPPPLALPLKFKVYSGYSHASNKMNNKKKPSLLSAGIQNPGMPKLLSAHMQQCALTLIRAENITKNGTCEFTASTCYYVSGAVATHRAGKRIEARFEGFEGIPQPFSDAWP